MGFLTGVTNLPPSDDGAALGSSTLRWSDLFLAPGAVIDVGDGQLTLTATDADTWVMAGGQFQVPAGTVDAPGLAATGETTDGLRLLNNAIWFCMNGLEYFEFNTGGLQFVNADGILWSDSRLAQESANVLQQGVDAAVPNAQTYKGSDARAGTDTNTVGGRMNWRTGLSTGNAVPAVQSMQGGAATVTSGTGAQTVVDRFIPNAFKVLTDGSAIAVVNATIANGTSVGGFIVYTIEVWDGTDNQIETGTAVYSSKNKAGTVTGTITEVSSQQDLDSGTLTTTWAISAANPAVISVNANSSLTPSTGYPRITFAIFNHGQQAVAIQ